MIEKTVVVTNRLGIHARPATVFVQAAAKFQA
ncbi:MAG: HPr family phosphocarrier protein, partial [Candidatus Latescibacterota bacterium]|nr:HPr family phosphocarrier protein [Candidatus Latescibacterota bacterium]